MAQNVFTGVISSSWGTLGNWSLLSVPTAGDGNIATFDGTSPACTVNVASVANNIDFTNYTNTITMTNTITVSGNVTLGASMTFAGASALLINAASTMTSNAKTLNIPLTLSAAVTYTLADNWTVTGNFTASTAGTHTINGNTLNLGANYSAGGGITVTGTTNIVMNGTGSMTFAGLLQNNLTFNTAGTITINAATHIYNTGTITYTAGTISVSGSTLQLSDSATLNTNGMSWNNINISKTTAMTVTLSSNLSISGTLDIIGSGATATTFTFSGAGVWTTGTLTFAGNAGGKTVSLVAGQTYTVTGSFVCTTSTAAAPHAFISSVGGSQTNLKLNIGATQDIRFLNGTDIDSSGGQTIQPFSPTLSNTTNWLSLVANRMVAFSYCG